MYRVRNKQTEQDNTIGVAIKRGTTVFVYGNNGDILYTRTGDEVVGYTCGTFAIRQGQTVHVYDSKGKQLYTIPYPRTTP